MRPEHGRREAYLARCPSNWERHTVREVGEVQAGKALAATQSGTPKPYLRVANVFDGRIDTSDVKSMPFTPDEWERYLLRPGDVLLNEGQSLHLVGRAAMYKGSPANCAFQNALIRFTSGSSIEPDFAVALFRFLQQSGVFAEISLQTTTVAHLGVSRFAGLTIAIPPLGEQRKIAAILSSVDDAIEATQAVIEQLQVVKKAMMAELLTRGLPGRHTRFKQTELGEHPENWKVLKLGELARVTSGGTPDRSRNEYWGGHIPWVKTGEINYEMISTTEERISTAGIENSAAKVVPRGTLVMAMYGQGVTRGRVAMLDIDAALNQACLAILQGDQALNRFLFFVFSARYAELRMLGNEGSQKNLNAALVKNVSIAVPPLDEQSSIVAVLESIDARIAAERTVLQASISSKAALMSVLLTGEVRVIPDDEVAA